MKTKVTLIVLVVVSFFNCNCLASDDARADKTRFNSLVRELRTVEAEYHQVVKQAVSEKKKDNQASLETKSRMMFLSDKRDRIMDRLTIISLRHGWDIPDNKDSKNIDDIPDEKQRIFARADEVIRESFTQQAKKIAESITLPVISMEPKDKSPEKTLFIFPKESQTAKKQENKKNG